MNFFLKSLHLIIKSKFSLRGWCHFNFIIIVTKFCGHSIVVFCKFTVSTFHYDDRLYGMMIVSLGIGFWLCEVFKSDTPVELGATFVIVAYGWDDGKNIAFECNKDADFDVELAQFEIGRPRIMHCELEACFGCDWFAWFEWRGWAEVAFRASYK